MEISKTKKMTLVALFTALIAVCAQLVFPLPIIPISLALFAVHMAGALLGPKLGTLAAVTYALLGAIGLPVFAKFQGGAGILFGKTGGYIIGYIFCALVVGIIAKKRFTFPALCAAMALGTLACYTFGTIWFMALTHSPLAAALGYCVLPFLPGDVIKILLAAILSKKLKPILIK